MAMMVHGVFLSGDPRAPWSGVRRKDPSKSRYLTFGCWFDRRIATWGLTLSMVPVVVYKLPLFMPWTK